MKAILTVICIKNSSEDFSAGPTPTWWVADDDELIIGDDEISEVLRLSQRPLIYSQGDLDGGTVNIE